MRLTITPPVSPPLAEEPLAVSPYGMFTILDYTPREGDEGVPISVGTYFKNDDPSRHLFLRLIVGNRPITTSIVVEDQTLPHIWHLKAIIPPLHLHEYHIVPITVQAIDDAGRVMDQITFGNFQYWQAGEDFKSMLGTPLAVPSATRPHSLLPQHRHMQHEAKSLGPVRNVRKTPTKDTHNARRPDKDTLQKGTPRKGRAERAVIQLVNPLEDMTKNFTAEELRDGRRLVRFTRTQDGNKLCVSCHPIRPEDWEESHIVVSCIVRPSEGPCITSVDIIALLQHLVQDQFSVEEKNRIRRNLEGFHPATVSKTKPETEVFFREIMEFPEPRPRNIEKDLKVFDWDVLQPALEKIIQKYSLFTTPKHESIPESSNSQPSSSENYDNIQLQYPTHQPSSSSSSPLSYSVAHASGEQPPPLQLDPVLSHSSQSSASSSLSPESADAVKTVQPELSYVLHQDDHYYQSPQYSHNEVYSMPYGGSDLGTSPYV